MCINKIRVDNDKNGYVKRVKNNSTIHIQLFSSILYKQNC